MSIGRKARAVAGGVWLATIMVPVAVYAGLRVVWWYMGELWEA